MSAIERLFTARFALMFSFSFTVFLAAFQLLPTAPFQILALGGSQGEAGLFLGLLTYASALSAPLTGAVADRVGKRRMLLSTSSVIAMLSAGYAVAPGYQWMLGLVLVHGVFWSGLLTASGAYVTDLLPPTRRTEGLGYWGFASIMAVAVAPSVGLWVFGRGGWTMVCAEATVLHVLMALIAWRLPADRPHVSTQPLRLATLVEWRVLMLGGTLFLYAFSYGGITSFAALYADQLSVAPRAIYFTVFSVTIMVTRPFIARYADLADHRRVIVVCLLLVAGGMAVMAMATNRSLLMLSAVLFGTGFGSAYPVMVSALMKRVPASRRGATFGALIGAFDTGIGSGSIAIGWLGQWWGLSTAYAVAAGLAACAVPYYVWAERRFSPPPD
jgi:MFS family permease